MAYIGNVEPLAANGTWTSGSKVTDRADAITGTIFADQTGTLYIEQSNDGTNWDLSTSVAVAASTGKGFKEELYAPHVRLRYVNGATAQGAFRVYARFSSAGDS